MSTMLRRVGMFLASLVAFLAGYPVAFGTNEVTTTVLTNDEVSTYISEKCLRTALLDMSCYQFGEKFKLPLHEGRTFQATRYESIYLPMNPLSEGSTPANTAMSISRVTATAEQWGQVVTIPDVPQLSIKHDCVQKGIARLGESMAKTFERETQKTLMSATNTQFANGAANRTALTAADVMTSLEISKAVSNLRKNGAAPWKRTATNTSKAYIQHLFPEGGGAQAAKFQMGEQLGLIGVCDPDVEQDINQDATFTEAAAYSNVRALQRNEIGTWKGVTWIRSNVMPYLTLLSSPSCAGANMTGFAGGLSASTDYDLVVTRVSKTYGLEEAVSATIDVNTGGGADSISVALPSGASYMYRIYIGTNAGTKYVVTSVSSATTVAADDITGPLYEGNQTVYVTAVPTTGDSAPVAPSSGVTVHLVWIFGAEAFGVVELDPPHSYLVKGADKTDPLDQLTKLGWKAFFKSLILNHNYVRLIECGSAFAG